MASPAGRSKGPVVVETTSAEETRRLAAALAPVLVPGDVIVLAGDLGAGKTTFVQGLAAGLGIVDRVTSPTFILMKEYLGGRFPLMHLDIYRLGKVQDVIDLGYDEFLDPSYVVAVEWGDRVEALLPQEHLKVELRHDGGDHRTLHLSATGDSWTNRLQMMLQLAAETKFGSPAQPGRGKSAPTESFLTFDPGDPGESGRN